jgi:hypothetical protein
MVTFSPLRWMLKKFKLQVPDLVPKEPEIQAKPDFCISQISGLRPIMFVKYKIGNKRQYKMLSFGPYASQWTYYWPFRDVLNLKRK